MVFRRSVLTPLDDIFRGLAAEARLEAAGQRFRRPRKAARHLSPARFVVQTGR